MKKTLTKVFISLFIISTVLGSMTFADTTPVLRLTLEEAQQMALDNSVQYRLKDSYISDALDAYYKTDENNSKPLPVTSFLDYFKNQITPDIALDDASLNVKLSRLDKDVLKKTIYNNVKLAFIDIKKAQCEFDIKNNDIQNKLKDYEVAKINFQLENITSDALKQSEKAYNNSLSDRTLALQSVNKEIQTLNKYLGRELTDYNIEVVMELKPVDLSQINLDKIRESYINNSSNLYKLSEKANTAKKKYYLTKDKYDHYFKDIKMQNSRDDVQDALSDAERDYENARTAFEDATKDLDITLYSTMNILEGLRDAVSRLQRNVEDGKNDLSKLKLKFDLGLISRNEYEKQVLNLKTLESTLNSTIADMNAQYDAMMMYVESDTI